MPERIQCKTNLILQEILVANICSLLLFNLYVARFKDDVTQFRLFNLHLVTHQKLRAPDQAFRSDWIVQLFSYTI